MGSLPPGGGFRPALLWLRGVERGEGPLIGHVIPQVERRVRAGLSRQVDQGAAFVASARSAPRRPCRAERARPYTVHPPRTRRPRRPRLPRARRPGCGGRRRTACAPVALRGNGIRSPRARHTVRSAQRRQRREIAPRHDRRGDPAKCSRSPQGLETTGQRPGLQWAGDEGREGAVEIDRDQHPRPCSEGGARNTKVLAHFSYRPIRSDALSDALWLALLARSTPRRSWSLARVGRCGLTGADASASR